MSRTDKPNENWTSNTEVFIIEDGAYLAKKIEDNSPYIEFVLDSNGFLIDITPTERPPEPLPQPTPEDQIQMLKEQQARMDTDMAAFMDYVLGGV